MFRQFSVDHMKVGAANSTGADPDAHFARSRERDRGRSTYCSLSPRAGRVIACMTGFSEVRGLSLITSHRPCFDPGQRRSAVPVLGLPSQSARTQQEAPMINI